MNQFKFFISIVPLEERQDYLDFYKNFGINGMFFMQCKGTASNSVLEKMGLLNNDKTMIFGFINTLDVTILKSKLYLETSMKNHGCGLTMILPSGAFGGESTKQYFLGEKENQGEEKIMSEVKANLSLIITIVDKGYTELVMDSAKSAGATGGTVINAKGTGTEMAKFFGVSLSEEKEMVYIIAKKEIRNDIMQAIMLQAGKNTDAHGITFSLPVESVVGISALENV